mgnify:CR=1 FL=1
MFREHSIVLNAESPERRKPFRLSGIYNDSDNVQILFV